MPETERLIETLQLFIQKSEGSRKNLEALTLELGELNALGRREREIRLQKIREAREQRGSHPRLPIYKGEG